MSYTTDRAQLLANLLERIATLNAHQLVGHRDNLQFWIAEVVSALGVIDGYPARFRNMRKSQVEWVRSHNVRVSSFCPLCGGACEFGPDAPEPPRRVPDVQMQDARSSLIEATRRLLRRLYRSHMASRDEIVAVAERIGTGFEDHELEREEPEGEMGP